MMEVEAQQLKRKVEGVNFMVFIIASLQYDEIKNSYKWISEISDEQLTLIVKVVDTVICD